MWQEDKNSIINWDCDPTQGIEGKGKALSGHKNILTQETE